MAEVNSKKLLEFESHLFQKAVQKLSEMSGKILDVEPVEAKPFNVQILRDMFTEQPVIFQSSWAENELGLLFFVDRELLRQTMPSLSGRGGPWQLEDEQSPSEMQHVASTGMEGFLEAWREHVNIESQFGELKVQLQPSFDTNQFSDYYMVILQAQFEAHPQIRLVQLISEDILNALFGSDEESAGDSRINVQQGAFSEFQESDVEFSSTKNLDMLLDVELPIAVELGRVKMQVKDVLELGPGAVVELNKFSGEPVDLFVNNKKFAEGEVVVVDQNFGVRITALIGANERIRAVKEGA